ncbi:hypothetical protein [Rubritalea tangerina]|uniref:hypothetical protein n=1 Tax=Rubritalea tangerina TaxID=430798 RepID=UPI003612FD8B
MQGEASGVCGVGRGDYGKIGIDHAALMHLSLWDWSTFSLLRAAGFVTSVMPAKS